MRSALQRLTVVIAFAFGGTGAFAQDPAVPVGNWQSPRSETFTNALHPALTGGEIYLNINVAKDGSFRGEWGEYFCSVSIGAYGIVTAPCRLTGQSQPVSGRFGPGRQGAIDLGPRGRSPFTWRAASPEDLVIELPKNWLGADALLYRARMTRDGKRGPGAGGASAPSPGGDAGPLLSAVALYREFKQDSRAALTRHAGKTMELEGRRGTLIELSDGGAAIHIEDGFTARALVLTFRSLRDVSGIKEGEPFRFRCRLDSFDYGYVHLNGCVLVR